MSLLIPTVVALWALLAPGSAFASHIAATGGDVVEVSKYTVISIGSLAPDAFTSTDTIRAFEERSSVQLTAPVPVDISPSWAPTPGQVDAGEWVRSCFIHGDRGGSILGTISLSGTIEFSDDILGIITTDANLDGSDGVLRLPGVSYPTGLPNRGLESGASADVVTITGRRSLQVDLQLQAVLDQVRVILRGSSRAVSFSIDFQGPTRDTTSTFPGSPISEGDVLTVGNGGAPGPNPPVPAPVMIPGVMLPHATLGIVNPGAFDIYELDALSFGRDWGRRLRFSVDEWATGQTGGAAPDVNSEGAFGAQEAASDVFAYRAPFRPTPSPAVTYGNRDILDGNGSTRPGFGLIEPNPAMASFRDAGDNLDALDLGTTRADVDGAVYFSLDAAYLDPFETTAGRPPNAGTAEANGFHGGDVLIYRPGVGVSVYASYAELGLLDQGEEGKDDIDALILWDDGDREFEPGVDHIFFSLRRRSASIGRISPGTGDAITEADILRPPTNPTVDPPVIVVHGEALGLCTTRVGCNASDDLNAADLVAGRNPPYAGNDQGVVAPGGSVLIHVVANDFALEGDIDVASVVIFEPPEHGTIESIGPRGEVFYVHDGSPFPMDRFTYIVFDDRGEFSEPAVVELRIDGAVATPEGQGPVLRSLLEVAGANPTGTISSLRFETREAGRVTLEVFDPAGRLVRRLFESDLDAGERRTVEWDGTDDSERNVGAGLYLVKLTTPGGWRQTRVIRLQ